MHMIWPYNGVLLNVVWVTVCHTEQCMPHWAIIMVGIEILGTFVLKNRERNLSPLYTYSPQSFTDNFSNMAIFSHKNVHVKFMGLLKVHKMTKKNDCVIDAWIVWVLCQFPFLNRTIEHLLCIALLSANYTWIEGRIVCSHHLVGAVLQWALRMKI